MRKYYWYLTAYARKHGKIILITLLGAILIFSLTLPLILSRIATKKTEYIALVGAYTLETLPDEIIKNLSFGLTKMEPDGTVSPALSERWSIEEEGKIYRFIIKNGLLWQDGKKFVPEDVNYELEDTQIIATKNDVVFKLPDKFVPFPTFVTKPLLRHETTPWLFILRRKKVIGLGRFQLTSYKEQGKRLKEATIESPSEKRIYRFYLTQADAVTAFKKGEVDVLKNFDSTYGLETWSNVILNENSDKNKYLALFFDLENPLFPKNIRQSFSYALHKPTDKSRSLGPISPDSWVYLEANKTYDYDLERATERALSEIPGIPLEFTLNTVPSFADTAEQIKQELESFGTQAAEACQKNAKDKTNCDNLKIKISLQIQTFPDLNNFESLLISRDAPADPDQYSVWHSGQADNFMNYKNTRIDSLLEKGRQVAEKEERKSIYQEFQQFLLEDAPAVFIEHPTTYEIRRK